MSTESMAAMTANNNENKQRSAEVEAAVELVRRAKEQGLALTGPDSLLKQLTKTVLETALAEEMNEHLGRAKHEKSTEGRSANTRNGTTSKTVTSDAVGPVRIEVPRDRDAACRSGHRQETATQVE